MPVFVEIPRMEDLKLLRFDPLQWVRSLRLEERPPEERDRIVAWFVLVAMYNATGMIRMSCELPDALRTHFEIIGAAGVTADWETLPSPVADKNLGDYLRSVHGELVIPVKEIRERLAKPANSVSIEEFLKREGEVGEFPPQYVNLVRGIAIISQGLIRHRDLPLNSRGEELLDRTIHPSKYEERGPAPLSSTAMIGVIVMILVAAVAFFAGVAVSSWFF